MKHLNENLHLEVEKEINEKKLKNLIKYVKNLRNVKGITGVELSNACNKSPNYIAKFESGKLGMPKIETLCAMAKALGVSTEDMLSKAGYKTERQKNSKQITLENFLTQEADNFGLSTELTKSLVNLVSVVLHSQQQEVICRTWFKDIITNYFMDRHYDEKGNLTRDKRHCMDWTTELINYANNQEFNIEDIIK